MREHVDGEVYWVVTNGIKESGMPPSASVLSERARWQVVAYVRTLAQERKDLVAFLKNLTDEDFLTDPLLANPWKK